MNIIDEINTLIKKYAPRPHFTNQKHLEDIIQNESLAEVRADFVMNEWVIGHITEIIEKYQEPNTGYWREDETNMYTCSNCSHCFSIVPEDNSIKEYKYCPNCRCHMVDPQESEDK